MKKLLLIILFLFVFNTVTNAQNFEWLKAYGTKNGIEDNWDVAATKDGGAAMVVNYHKVYNSGTYDTMRFGNFQFPIYSSSTAAYQSFIVKVDSTGKVVKVATNLNFMTRQIISNKDGDFIVVGSIFTKDSSTIGNKSYFRVNGATMVIKYDKDLNLIWAKQMGGKSTISVKLTISDNALCFIFAFSDTAIMGSKTYNTSSSAASYIYGELNPLNGNIKWSQCLYINQGTIGNPSFFLTSIIKTKHKIFVSGMSENAGVKIAGDTIYGNTGFIIQTDSLGNYEKRYCMRTKNKSIIKDLTTDGNNIYFCGDFRDSIYWDINKIIAPNFKTGTSNYELFAAAISLNFKPLWFFRPEIINKTLLVGGGLNQVIYNQGFLYFGGGLGNNALIDSFVFTSTNYNSDIFILKSDIRGNVLWVTNGGGGGFGYINGLDAIAEQSVFATGEFGKDTLKLGKLMVTSPNFGKTTDVFITKLSDNGIIRGTVKSGPYCAGDSITIPYTKIGSYDTANYFMAQLSNEEGNFDKGFVNLGRIKSNKDGTIKGKIPLSNISSSGKYRIRIMSTLPAVQSYYKADTLRLLIYSRDKANPGPDTTICPGDTVLLRTYGGTKWKWSPGLRMQDSSNYKTKTWPNKTTRYTIIIADSSGCGAPDTAYKTVTIRKDPKINILTKKDTAVCLGATVPIIASFQQGDSSSYSYNWYSISPLGVYTELKAGSRQQKDTLYYKMPAGVKDSQRLILFLSDGCNKKTDFKYYTIFISKVKTKASLAKDTIVCPGTTAAIIAKFTQGSSSNNYNWRWYDVPKTGSWIALSPVISNKTADTLRYALALTASKAKKIGIRLQDNCTGLADTVYQTITPADTLSLKLNVQDTQLCKGQQYGFKATGKGGNAKGYNYVWLSAANDTLSKADSMVYTANNTSTITLTLSDGCMAKTISKQLNIKVTPAISTKIELNNTVLRDTSICYGNSLSLLANSQGGKGSGYAYQWLVNNTPLANSILLNINPSQYTLDTGGIVALSLITTDNCTTLPDTTSIRLNVLPKLQLQVGYKDSMCYQSTNTIQLKAKGGKANNYQYQWLNAQQQPLQGSSDSLVIAYTSAIQSGLHTYYAILSDGCSINDTITISQMLLPPLSLSLSTNNACPAYSSLLKANITGGKGYGYQLQWWRNGQLLSSTKDTLTAYAQGQANIYRVMVKDACSTVSDTAQLLLGVQPNIQLIADKDSGCAPMQLKYTIATTYQQAFNWTLYTGNNNDSISGNHTQVSPMLIYNTGIYTAKLKVLTATGCQVMLNGNTIRVHPKPIAKFWQSSDNLTLNYPELKLENRSSNAAQYQWLYPPIGSSTNTDLNIKYTDTGIYTITLIAISSHQCTDSITNTVIVSNDLQILMPNAFTPNGDNVNDVFKPIGVGIQKLQITIYNRWGELMYSSDDKNGGWDGTFMGKQVQQGAYLYLIKARGLYGPFQYFKGMIMLSR